MQINARQKSAVIVRPLVMLLKNVGRKTCNSTSHNYVQSAHGTYTVPPTPSAYTVTTPPYASPDFSGSMQYDSAKAIVILLNRLGALSKLRNVKF